MPNISIGYEPLPKQKEFHQSNAKYRAYVGGVGSGKTFCGCMEALKTAMNYPGSLGLIARFTYPELRDTTRRTFFDICPPEIIKEWKVSENHLILINGSEILFRTLDDSDKLKSLNLDWWYIDEASETKEEVFNMLKGRLRGTKGPRRGWLTSNPEGHDWIWKNFVKFPLVNGNLTVAPTTENKYLPKDYIDDLLNAPEVWKKRYVYGMFDAFEGQIYDMFNDNVHIIAPIKPPKEWEMVIGLDHGYRNPTAAVFAAIDYDGNVYIYDEYYDAGNLVSYHADKIRRKVLGNPPSEMKLIIPGMDVYSAQKKWEHAPIEVIIDPSTRNKNPINGLSVQAEYAEYNFVCINGNNEVLAGINRVGEYFQANKLYICSNCVNLIEEIHGYKWDDNHGEEVDKEKPLKQKDHAVDALRYLIMSRPVVPKQPLAQKPKTYSQEVWEWLKHKSDGTRQNEYLGDI